jgi:sensor histidine kinase YesM
MMKLKPNGFLGLHPKIIDNFFLLILVLGFSTGVAIIQRLRQNETQQKEIEKARVDSELAFLKNQISPHFFFNSLNNIYALIAVDTDKAQDAVEKLSGLMRYLIYESDIKTVELQKEFEFTQNYIDLMQQRLTSKVKLEINIQQKLPKVEIPPLIFIPFIENAFKHGISYREDSFITVDLRIENDCVVFDCSNSIPQQAKESVRNGGVGIVNIQKRLGLIYGERAQLTMDNDGSAHSVHLVIPLN